MAIAIPSLITLSIFSQQESQSPASKESLKPRMTFTPASLELQECTQSTLSKGEMQDYCKYLACEIAFPRSVLAELDKRRLTAVLPRLTGQQLPRHIKMTRWLLQEQASAQIEFRLIELWDVPVHNRMGYASALSWGNLWEIEALLRSLPGHVSRFPLPTERSLLSMASPLSTFYILASSIRIFLSVQEAS